MIVRRRVFARKRWLLWHIERIDGRDVRRVLIDLDTGEVLDEVILLADGSVDSYSARADPPSTGAGDEDASPVAGYPTAGLTAVELRARPRGHRLAA
jgi:hypothetical protein